MAKEEVKKEELKNQEIEIVKIDDTPVPDQKPMSKEDINMALAPFIAFLNPMKTTKTFIDVAPTDTPKNFYDSIRFYDTGGVRRLYLYINGDWRYVVLT